MSFRTLALAQTASAAVDDLLEVAVETSDPEADSIAQVASGMAGVLSRMSAPPWTPKGPYRVSYINHQGLGYQQIDLTLEQLLSTVREFGDNGPITISRRVGR